MAIWATVVPLLLVLHCPFFGPLLYVEPMKPNEPEHNALVRRARMQGRGNIIFTRPGKSPFENNTDFPADVGNFMGDGGSPDRVAVRNRSRNDFKRYAATGGRLVANPLRGEGIGGYDVKPGQAFAAHQRNLAAPPIKGEVRRPGETVSPPGPFDQLREKLKGLGQPAKPAPAPVAAAETPTANERAPAPQGFGAKVRDLFNQPSPMQKLYRRIRG